MLKKFCLLAVVGAFAAAQAQDPEVRINPVSIGAFQEWGMIRKGQYTTQSRQAIPFENDWIDHFGASLGMSAVVNDRLYVSAGLGGIFQFRKPESVNIGYEGSQRKGFFIGPSTEAVYHFGEDPVNPFLKLGVGSFWYKYNPNASNLGEYLFRSEGYPTYTYTGGYSIIGSSGAQLQGFKALFRRGNLTLDLLLTTETNLAPFYNWSPAAIVSYSVADGLLNVGAGVNFKHLFQVKPSRSQQKNMDNGYFKYQDTASAWSQYQDQWFYSSPTYYEERAQFYDRTGDAASAAEELNKALFVSEQAGNPATDMEYFDARSTLIMARASLDPKKLFESDLFGAEDLKIFTEVGVLGIKNYPVFYKKVSERMPVMVGLNLPGFKVLDLISVQAEYMNSPNTNNNYARSVSGANVPFYPGGVDPTYSENEYNDIAGRDNFKWSLLLRKSLGGVTLSMQAASDHLRVPSSAFYYGPQFDPMEITVTKRQWYFMTQLAWGI